MLRHNPAALAAPFATYSHGVEVRDPRRVLFAAGQVGVDGEGVAADGIAEQAELVWRNIGEVLASADMSISDIVQLNMLLVDRADYPIAARIRGEHLGDHRPATTLMYVAGLARPEWRIEIDFVAIEA